jgi:hypothetical protein
MTRRADRRRLGKRYGSCDEVSLGAVTAELTEADDLFRSLDAFGGDP